MIISIKIYFIKNSHFTLYITQYNKVNIISSCNLTFILINLSFLFTSCIISNIFYKEFKDAYDPKEMRLSYKSKFSKFLQKPLMYASNVPIMCQNPLG